MFIISLYCKIMEKQKNTRNTRTLEEKYKIIKYYESIEHIGRDAKKKTIDKFNLARHTTLNTILSQSDEIVSIYESNQASIHIFLYRISNHEIEDDLHKIIQSSKTQSLITDFWK